MKSTSAVVKLNIELFYCVLCCVVSVLCCVVLCTIHVQIAHGPQSNFEIGGGGGGAPLVTQYWGHKTLFLTKSL